MVDRPIVHGLTQFFGTINGVCWIWVVPPDTERDSVKKQVQASKIKLVVTDDAQTPVQADPDLTHAVPPEPLNATKYGSDSPSHSTIPEAFVDIDDVDKLMAEVPLDDFFRVLESASPAQLQSLVRKLEAGAKSKGGSNLWMKLIGVPAGPRNIASIVWWWECRRWLYNVIVGMIGLPFAGLVWLLFDGVPSNGFLVILGMVYYGIGANLCYCLGAPAELVAKACWKENTQPYGPVLLTLGLIFSVLLTIGLGALSLLYAGWMGFHLLPLQQ